MYGFGALLHFLLTGDCPAEKIFLEDQTLSEIGQTMVGGGESFQERAAEDYESAGFGMYSQRA